MSPVWQSITTHDPEFVAHPARGIGLQAGVDGERQGAAAGVRNGGKLADQLAARGDLEPLRARAAAQPRLHRLFKAFLADLEAGRDQKRVLLLLIFLLVGGADIADQMADRGARPDRSG